MALIAGVAQAEESAAGEAVKRWSSGKKEGAGSVDLRSPETPSTKPISRPGSAKPESRRYLSKGETETRSLCLEKKSQCLCADGQYLTVLPNLDLETSSQKAEVVNKKAVIHRVDPKKKVIAKMGCVPTCASGSQLRFRSTGKNRVEAECKSL